MKRFFARFGGPQSLRMLARGPRPAPIAKLYVLEVDFELKDEPRKALERNLDVLRGKYGIDFFVIEPGFRIKRFEDF